MGGVFMSAFVVMAVLRWHQPAGLAAAASVLSVTVLLVLNLLSSDGHRWLCLARIRRLIPCGYGEAVQ